MLVRVTRNNALHVSAKSTLYLFQVHPGPCRCLEIGSGSGYVICSAVRLLHALGVHPAHVMATDCSAAALEATAGTLQAHQVMTVDVRGRVLGGSWTNRKGTGTK